MAVPALEARRRRRRCSRPGPSRRGEAGLGDGGARRARRGGSPSAARRSGATNTGVHRPERPDRAAGARGGGAAPTTRRRSSTASTGCGSSSSTASSRRSCPTRRSSAGVEIQPLAEVLAHRHPLGARALRRCSRRAARTPVDRPLAVAQHRAGHRRRGDPGDGRGAAKPVSLVYLPRAPRRRTRWSATWSGSSPAPT